MNQKTLITVGVLVLILIGLGWVISQRPLGDKQMQNQTPVSESQAGEEANLPTDLSNKKAEVVTNFGSFTIEFFDEDAPLAVENFIRLSQEGKYADSPFHRVINGFMIQGGDYTRGDGTGGQSIWGEPFADELDPESESGRAGYLRGTVAMANAGPNTNGSQFFIMHADYPLPHSYTIFGRVVEGLETIDAIANVEVLENSYGEPSVPTEKIVIEEIIISER